MRHMLARRICVSAAAVLLLGSLAASPSLALGDDAPQPPTASAQATPAAPAPERRTEGLIPYILIGPKVSATLLFPPNVMVGAEVKALGYVGASFEYGVFPKNHNVNEYSVHAQDTWSLGLRAYPFQGTFFVGAVLGNYDLTGTQVANGGTSTLNVKSMYLGPQIGWKWDFDFGLFLGLNLGYGFSLNYSSTLVQPPGVSGGDLQTAKDNADKYLKPGAPILTLLEVGWFL